MQIPLLRKALLVAFTHGAVGFTAPILATPLDDTIEHESPLHPEEQDDPDIYVNVFDPEMRVQLRCWYRTADTKNIAAARSVTANDFVLRGKWNHSSWLYKRSLFYTWQQPEELREACENTLRGIPEATDFLDWTAATNGASWNHQIWHNGVIVSAHERPVERIVTFGDSLSDTGNMFNETEWLLPHRDSWLRGRFSNGPVWTEYLARATGLPLNNWAVGGAQTDVAHGLIDSIDEQVESFIKYVRSAKNYDETRTLFTVLIGGNDFMNNTSESPDSVREVLLRTQKALARLVGFGAKKILLVNLPDISRAPYYADGTGATLLRDKVRFHNEALPTVVSNVTKGTDADIRILDLGKHFDELIDHPERFGIDNVTLPCLDIGKGSGEYVKAHAQRAGCDPARNLFWDQLHPTTRIHALMAGWAIEAAGDDWGLKSP